MPTAYLGLAYDMGTPSLHKALSNLIKKYRIFAPSDLVVVKRQILHPEPQRFRDPHPGAVNQPCKQALCTVHSGQQGLHLLTAEYYTIGSRF